MFAVDDPVYNRDDCMRVFYELRQRAAVSGYEVEQIYSLDSIAACDLLIVFDIFPEKLMELDKIPKEKRILFLWEPPSTVPNNENLKFHDLFQRIYTWNDDWVDNVKYFKFYYPVLQQMNPPQKFGSKKLAAMIACNKWSAHPQELYSERWKVIQFFEGISENYFDLYGKWWPGSLRNYRGSVERKSEVLKNYKFSFAYENMYGISGYITEKIFDCFHAGTVPIYFGAGNIETYIPKNCFISRQDFSSDAELLDHLTWMSESAYQGYLDRIQEYLHSDAAKLYSKEHFIHIFMDALDSLGRSSK